MDLAAIEKAFGDQEIVAHDAAVAKALAASAKIRSLRPDDTLFAPEGKRLGVVHFIISGKIKLLFGKRVLAILGDKQCLGEFPLLDTKFLTNQVTAQACENTIVAEVGYQAFEGVALQHPFIWRRIARSLALRLDQGNRAGGFSEELRRYEQVAAAWLRLSRTLWLVHYTMGGLALLLSGIVSAKIAVPGFSQDVLAWLAALMTGLLAFLSPEGRAIRLRQAWVMLNVSLAKARADPAESIHEVIQAHQQGEAVITKSKDGDASTSSQSPKKRAART